MLRLRLFPKRGISLRKLVVQTFRSYFEKGGPTSAAAISYFTLITLFPAFLLLVALVDQFIKVHGISRELAERIIALFPLGTRTFILTNLDTMISASSWGSIITYASIFLWAGMWVFHIVEEALDKAWNVQKKRSFLASMMIHFSMIIISSLCMVGSTALVATLQFLRSRFLPPDLLLGKWFFQLLLFAIAYLLMAALFFLIYKIIPATKVSFFEALSGAIISATIWHVVNYIFVWTIPFFHYENVYGSVWALVVIIVWIYVSSLIMVIGAHFTYHIHRYSEAAPGNP